MTVTLIGVGVVLLAIALAFGLAAPIFAVVIFAVVAGLFAVAFMGRRAAGEPRRDELPPRPPQEGAAQIENDETATDPSAAGGAPAARA